MDIVERLRKTADALPPPAPEPPHPHYGLMHDAAHEIVRRGLKIERLREALKAIVDADDKYELTAYDYLHEGADLRDALRQARIVLDIDEQITPSCGCAFCDLNVELHEDNQGLHHLSGGERTPCTRS